MTNGEILKKAIARAEKYGYVSPSSDSIEWQCFEAIIFGHDFAKAFWGNRQRCFACGGRENSKDPWCVSCDGGHYDGEEWKYHLMQMI